MRGASERGGKKQRVYQVALSERCELLSFDSSKI